MFKGKAIYNPSMTPNSYVYFKDSLLKQAGVSRSELPDNCVTPDFNLFKAFDNAK